MGLDRRVARRATLAGFAALALWSTFAVLAAGTGAMPPFQLLAVTFGLGGLAGLLFNRQRLGRAGLRTALCQPPRIWALGVGALFGYHALYFTALRLAPPAEAGLFNYLWPLLLVLGAALFPADVALVRASSAPARTPAGSTPSADSRPAGGGPGGGLRRGHVFGALLGFAGIGTLLFGPQLAGSSLTPGLAGPGALDAALEITGDRAVGDLCAFAAAFVWAGWSLASRRLGEVSTAAISGFCVAASVLAAGVHVLFERTVWPETPGAWGMLITLALGPSGASFLLWDRAVKSGDLPLLAASAYATPLVSTGLLVAAGLTAPTPALFAACLLIVTGAVVAGRAP